MKLIFIFFLFLCPLCCQEAIASLKTSEKLESAVIRTFPDRDTLEQLLIDHTKDVQSRTWQASIQNSDKKSAILKDLEGIMTRTKLFNGSYLIEEVRPMPMLVEEKILDQEGERVEVRENPFAEILIHEHFRLARANSFGYWEYLLTTLPGNTFTTERLKSLMSEISILVFESHKQKWAPTLHEALKYEVKVTGGLLLQILLAFVPAQVAIAKNRASAGPQFFVKTEPGVPYGQHAQPVLLSIKSEPGTNLPETVIKKPMLPPSLPKLPSLQVPQVGSQTKLIKPESGPATKKPKIG